MSMNLEPLITEAVNRMSAEIDARMAPKAAEALQALGWTCTPPDAEAWEYAHVYYDEGGNPQVQKVQKVDFDAHRPDGHRSDGSPYWNYTPHRRRKAGPWEPVE